MPVATPDDVELNVPGCDVDKATLAYWISVAEMLIEHRLGDLAELPQNILRFVVIEAVSDRARNPDGLSRVDISADDAGESRTFTRGSAHITIKSEWWDMLAPTEKRPAQAFTIEPVLGTGQATTSIDFSQRPDLAFQYGWPTDGVGL